MCERHGEETYVKTAGCFGVGHGGIQGDASGQQRRRHWRHGALFILLADLSIECLDEWPTCRSSSLAAMVCSIGDSRRIEVVIWKSRFVVVTR
jgi:hypothetical protein